MGDTRQGSGGRVPPGWDALGKGTRAEEVAAFLDLIGKFKAQGIPTRTALIPPALMPLFDKILERVHAIVRVLDQDALTGFVDACYHLVKWVSLLYYRDELRGKNKEYRRRLHKVLDLLLQVPVFLAANHCARCIILSTFLISLDLEDETSGVLGGPRTQLFLSVVTKKDSERITQESLRREWESLRGRPLQLGEVGLEAYVLDREVAAIEDEFRENIEKNPRKASKHMLKAMRLTWDFLNSSVRNNKKWILYFEENT